MWDQVLEKEVYGRVEFQNEVIKVYSDINFC